MYNIFDTMHDFRTHSVNELFSTKLCLMVIFCLFNAKIKKEIKLCMQHIGILKLVVTMKIV